MPAGTVVIVVAVRKSFVLLENGLQVVVAVDGLNVPPELEIVIPLYAYMKDTDGFLGHDRFERVEK